MSTPHPESHCYDKGFCDKTNVVNTDKIIRASAALTRQIHSHHQQVSQMWLNNITSTHSNQNHRQQQMTNTETFVQKSHHQRCMRERRRMKQERYRLHRYPQLKRWEQRVWHESTSNDRGCEVFINLFIHGL